MEKRHDIYRKEEPPSLAGRRNIKPAFRREWKRKFKPSTENMAGEDRDRAMVPPRHRPGTQQPITEHHTHTRHRRRKSRSFSIANILIIGGLAVVLIGYISFLVYSKIKNEPAKKPVVVKTAQVKPEEKPAVPPPPGSSISVDHLREGIQGWSKGIKIVKESNELINDGRVDKAISRLEGTLMASPDNQEAKIILAQALILKKDFPRAEELLLEILEANPHRQQAQRALAMVLYERGNHKAVIEVATWILEQEELQLDIHELIAKSYNKTDQTGKAITHYKRLAALDPNNIVAINNLALSYSNIGEFDEAIKLFNKMMTRDPSNSLTYFNLAVCFANLNRTGDAVSTLNKAADLFGNDFVKIWLKSEKFDSLKDKDSFRKLQERIMRNESQAIPDIRESTTGL